MQILMANVPIVCIYFIRFYNQCRIFVRVFIERFGFYLCWKITKSWYAQGNVISYLLTLHLTCQYVGDASWRTIMRFYRFWDDYPLLLVSKTS